MTQTDLNNYITTFRCCSADLAYEISNSLFIGGCDRTYDLILLLGYIEALEKYDLNSLTTNCLQPTDYELLVAKAKKICNSCGCNNK